MNSIPQHRISLNYTTFLLFIVAILMVLGFTTPALCCDVAVISAKASSTGRPILFKNFDCSAYYKQEVKYFPAKTSTAGDYMLLYHNDEYMELINDSPVMPQSGSNTAGFACSVAAVYEDLNQVHEARNLNTDLVQDAVERCATIADWENLLKTWPSSHYGNAISGNFVVVDAQGGAALYECYTGPVNIGLMKIQYRKYDANTGEVVTNTGKVIKAGSDNFEGFVTRTNINNYIWYNSGYDRYLRCKKILTDLAVKDPVTGKTRLNADNVMRLLSKDVIGKQMDPATTESHYSTTYCISRNATRSGTVFEGVAAGDDPRRSVYWTALGEPSIAVFVPNMIAAKSVSDYVYMDEIRPNGDLEDNDDSSLLCNSEDELETYNKLIYSNNRGDAATGMYSKCINKVELAKVQTWTFALEDVVTAKTHALLDEAQNNPNVLTPEYLHAFTNYCGLYLYQNYAARSASAMAWNFVPGGAVEEDKTPPTASIQYTTTAEGVDAELVNASEAITVTEPNDGSTHHLFKENGTFTFEFEDLAGNKGSTTATVTSFGTTPVDPTAPTATIQYTTAADGSVVAQLIPSEPVTVTNNNGSTTYTFTQNGSFKFEFVDADGKTGSATATVSSIGSTPGDPTDPGTGVTDTTPPTGTISYTLQTSTNQNVVATMVPSEDVTVTNNGGSTQYTFTQNGSFTFEFKDAAGNTGTATATVSWIDKTVPTASIEFDKPLPTLGPVTATLYPSEPVTMLDGTETTHLFTQNGLYTFKFMDAAGNIGTATANVYWIISAPGTGDVFGQIGSWFSF